MKLFLMLFILTILSLSSTTLAFPGWDNINTIYYNSSQDDAVNKFLLQASNELKTHLENVSLKTFTINNVTRPSVGIFLINDSYHPQLSGKNDESFWLYTNDSGVYIIGKTPIAVRHGAYTLLEKLGYRWFFKNPMWKVKPNSLTSLDGLNEVQQPAFLYRRIWMSFQDVPNGQSYLDWKEWNRLGGATRYDVYHNYNDIIPTSQAATYPTRFCYNSDGRPRQLNISNPEVVDIAKEFAISRLSVSNPTRQVESNDYLFPASIPVSPNDGPGWDSCFDPNDYPLITDKVFDFANQASKAVKETLGPNKYVGVYSYAAYSCTPRIDLESNLLVQVATGFDYCDESAEQRIENFIAKGVSVGVRDYYDVWQWWYDMPTSLLGRVGQLQFFANNNVKVINAESGDGWGARGPLYYLMSKLYWDSNADPGAILDDFYEKAFGPAKDAIKRYYNLWYYESSLTDEKVGLAFMYLDEAERVAGNNPQILDRIRFLEYYMHYVWKWRQKQSATGMTFDELRTFYQDMCKTYPWSVNWFRFVRYDEREPGIGYTLMNTYGLTKSDLDSLCNTTLPTSDQARAWLDEALAEMRPLNTKELVPLGTIMTIDSAMYPTLPSVTVGGDHTLFIAAKAGETVVVNIPSGSGQYGDTGTKAQFGYLWRDSDGNILEQVDPTLSPPVQLQLFAPKTDVYRLTVDLRGVNYVNFITINISNPAAFYVKSHFVGRGALYAFVPPNTPNLTVGMETGGGAVPAGFKVYDPTGQVVINRASTDAENAAQYFLAEERVSNPVNGIWRLEYWSRSSYGADLWVTGIPPLLWFDPQYLLVPANAILKLLLLQYRQTIKPIVDGNNITIEIPITFYDKLSTAFTVSKPLWNNTINFRFNESGSITSINNTYITFTVDPNKSVSLLFDIPPPRKTRDIATIQNSTFYRKEITISSDNSLVNITATIDINTTYTSYKLYELQGSTWIDVTSNYNLTISGNIATFSGFSTSEKQFRIEGSTEACTDSDNDNYYKIDAVCSLGNDCNDANPDVNPGATEVCGNGIDEDCSGADLSCPEQSPGGTSSGGSSGGGGAIVSISAPIEKPITKEPETTSPQPVTESAGTVSMELSAPDTVESGDYYDATVKILSPIKKTYTLKIADVQQQISLDAGKEKSVTIPVQAPDAKGAFALTASIDGTTRSKDISLNFLPLILTVDKSKSGNQTLINITVKNYQSLSTELRIIKDGRSDVFIELIEGKKEYQRQLKLTQPGEYRIIAVASSEGKVVDTDEYLLTITGIKQEYSYIILAVVVALLVLVGVVVFR